MQTNVVRYLVYKGANQEIRNLKEETPAELLARVADGKPVNNLFSEIDTSEMEKFAAIDAKLAEYMANSAKQPVQPPASNLLSADSADATTKPRQRQRSSTIAKISGFMRRDSNIDALRVTKP